MGNGGKKSSCIYLSS